MQSFQPVAVNRQEFTRTPSPGLAMQSHSQGISPVPGASMSSNSSPGSNSEHTESMPGPATAFGTTDPNTVTSSSMDTAPASQWAPTLTESNANVPRVVSSLSSASDPNLVATASKQKPSSPRSPALNAKPAPVRRRQNSKQEPNRRQKRLERNRESARLSRRRRKQYLEVLEEKVVQLGQEMDQGRRAHALTAVQQVAAKRGAILQAIPDQQGLRQLETGLARTSQELSIATTFQAQQLGSFSLAPSTKFMMWLTLQSDVFYRGGRAASERLSAARIGERVRIIFCSV